MNSKYWWTPEEKGLTPEQIDIKVEELWQKSLAEVTHCCPDCIVSPGEAHEFLCDVARCMSCKGQALSCGCEDIGEDIWTGLWPGIKECYELKLICWSDPNRIGGTDWTFDLNTLAEINARKKWIKD